MSLNLGRHSRSCCRCTLEGAAELPQLAAGTLPAGNGYSVLLAEDEDVVLSMGVEILEGLGYTVLAADSPAAALRLAADHDGHIDLLISDVIMPEMNGRELAERVQALRPAIKVLYISGYPADFISDRAVLADGVHFLQKPFSLRSLALQVHAALDGAGHVPAAPAQKSSDEPPICRFCFPALVPHRVRRCRKAYAGEEAGETTGHGKPVWRTNSAIPLSDSQVGISHVTHDS